MKWFELHARLPNHPKTRRLAELLEVDIASAVGHLVMMWSWCCEHARDGNLTGQANRDTARAFGWYGDPALLFRSLIAAGWLDQKAERLKVHDWQEYGGKRLKAADRQRKLAAERQRKHRARTKAQEAEAPVVEPAQPAQPTLPLEVPAKAAKAPKAAKVYEPAVHDLCARLADAIAAYCGERPKVNDEWLRDMERLVRLDKHAPDDVAALITWAFARSDGYWPPHLAKPVKLRKHWQTLKMQMTRDSKVVAHPAAGGGSTAVGPVQPARRGSINLGTDEQDAEIRAFLEKRGAQ